MKEFKKFEKLLSEYSELADETLGTLIEDLFDPCAYDIDGFNSIGKDEVLSLLPELENQVKAMRLIIRGYKQFETTFA